MVHRFHWIGDKLYCQTSRDLARPVYVRMPAGFQPQVNSVLFQECTTREIMVAACLKTP
jgi:hypothetical protein